MLVGHTLCQEQKNHSKEIKIVCWYYLTVSIPQMLSLHQKFEHLLALLCVWRSSHSIAYILYLRTLLVEHCRKSGRHRITRHTCHNLLQNLVFAVCRQNIPLPVWPHSITTQSNTATFLEFMRIHIIWQHWVVPAHSGQDRPPRNRPPTPHRRDYGVPVCAPPTDTNRRPIGAIGHLRYDPLTAA